MGNSEAWSASKASQNTTSLIDRTRKNVYRNPPQAIRGNRLEPVYVTEHGHFSAVRGQQTSSLDRAS
jgi:hypothetical protein